MTFYDFRNPSTEYLKWRLAKRDGRGAVLYAGEDELPRADLIFAINVVEHLPDPATTLGDIAAHAQALVVHLPLTTQQHKYPMHFPLNKRQLRRVIRDASFRRIFDLSQLCYKWGLLLPTETPDFWPRK